MLWCHNCYFPLLYLQSVLNMCHVPQYFMWRHTLQSIGHDDDLAIVEEDVLIQGYLDKKGPAYTIGTKK